MIKKSVLIVLLLCISTLSYAKLVLPEFSGEWFLNRSGVSKPDYTIYLNPCGNGVYNYKFKNSSALSLAASALAHQPAEPNCTWGAPALNQNDPYEMPVSYPGTQQQWETMASAKNPVDITETFSVQCKDKSGTVQHEASVDVYPVYKCPKGSRSYMSQSGCVTNPPVCDADILYRDMASKLAAILGHVGLSFRKGDLSSPTMFDSKVLEVLNKTPAINEDTFSSFADKPGVAFHGASYGVPSMPDLTQAQADDVLQVGENAERYPNAYWVMGFPVPSIIIELHVRNLFTGKWVPIIFQTTALFRCDSFVAYCYQKGLGVSLAPVFITPSIVFNSLKYRRDAFPSPVSPSADFEKQSYGKRASVASSCSTVACYQQALQTDLKANQFDVNAAQRDAQGYIKLVANSVTSSQYLYTLARQYIAQPIKYQVLLDVLYDQKPVQLLGQMTSDYIQSEKDGSAKNTDYSLLGLIVSSMMFENKAAYQNLTPAELGYVKGVQNLFVSILTKSEDKTEVIYSINQAFAIFPTDQAAIFIADAERRLNIKPSSRAAIRASIMIIFNHAVKGNVNLKESLTELYKHAGKKKADGMMMALANLINLKEFDKLFSGQFKSYVLGQKPSCMLNQQINADCVRKFHFWVNTYTKVMGYSGQKKYNQILKEMIALNNPDFSSKLILSYGPLVFKSSPKKDLKQLYSQLVAAKSVESSSVVGAALGEVKDVLSQQS